MFLSGLMAEVERLLGSHHVSTTLYHPQMDGHVEHFNDTLTAILAKLGFISITQYGLWNVLASFRALLVFSVGFQRNTRPPLLFDCNSSFAIFVLYECFLLLSRMHLQACSQAHCHNPSNLIDFINKEGST